MQRGVIELTNEDIVALKQVVKLERFGSSPLESKLSALFSDISVDSNNVDKSDEKPRNIELSADELESLMDEILMPFENEPSIMMSIRKRLSEALLKMRE